MLFRFAPPAPEHRPNEVQAGIWINTEHIVAVREVRRTEPDDEPLELEVTMVNGRQYSINVHQAGRGMAERLFEWLQSQQRLPEITVPKSLDKGGTGKAPKVKDSFKEVGASTT